MTLVTQGDKIGRMNTLTDKIELLQKIIDESSSIVFFGGAGVSTESGIPDFRSKNGLYNTLDVKFEKFKFKRV